jgi:hypothetical protein
VTFPKPVEKDVAVAEPEGNGGRAAPRLPELLRHPLAITAVSALLAGWLLPAFAHQWQDRQAERELKRELATQLDRDVTTTLINARLLIDRRFPEAQTGDVRLRELRRARLADRTPARAAYRAARERERVAGTETFVRTLSAWFVTRSVTRSTLAAHFPDSDLADRWTEYANHVTDYLFLASARPQTQERGRLLSSLKRYLHGGEHKSWRLLRQAPRPLAPRKLERYSFAAGHLAGTLLVRKNALAQDVIRAHAEGFSTRPRDLLGDLLPFVG